MELTLLGRLNLQYSFLGDIDFCLVLFISMAA